MPETIKMLFPRWFGKRCFLLLFFAIILTLLSLLLLVQSTGSFVIFTEDYLIPPEKISELSGEENNIFIYPLEEFVDRIRDINDLSLIEDDRQTGPPLSGFNIPELHNGAYSIERQKLFFTATDNTDPRNNNRVYKIRLSLFNLRRYVFLSLGLLATGLIVILALVRVLWSRIDREPATSSFQRFLQNRFKAQTLVILTSLAFFPILAVLLNPNIPFGNGIHFDTWFYFGLQLDLPRFVNSSNYFLSRLPALAPHYFFYRLLPPMAAGYVIFFLWYYLSIFSFFWASSMSFGRRPAFLSTVFFGCSTLFMGIYSHRYPLGPAIAYLTLSVALVIKARGAHHPLSWLAASGAALAAAIHSQFIMVFFGLATPLYYFSGSSLRSRDIGKKILNLIIGYSIGIILLTLFFCILNHEVFGGPLWFFKPQYDAVFRIFQRQKELWFWQRDLKWMSSPYLFFYYIGTASSLLYFLKNWRSTHKSSALNKQNILYCLSFLTMFSILAFYEWRGGVTLQYDWYNPGIWPVLFLALTPVFFPKTWEKADSLLFFTVLFLIMLAFLTASTVKQPAWPVRFFRTGNITYLAITIAVIGSIFGLLTDWKAVRNLFLVSAALCLLLFMTSFFPISAGDFPWQSNIPRWSGHNRYARLYAGQEFIASFKLGRYPVFWIDDYLCPETYMFPRANFLSFYYTDFPDLYPVFGQKWAQKSLDSRMRPGHDLVLIASGNDVVQQADLRLQSLGLKFIESGSKEISYGFVSYRVIVGRLESGKELPQATRSENLEDVICLYNVKEDTLIYSLEKNIYGGKDITDVLNHEHGGFLFSPTDSRDHLATPFLLLPPRKPGKTMILRVTLRFSGEVTMHPDLFCLVQDDRYGEIQKIVLERGERSKVQLIALRRGINKVRLVISSLTGKPVIIPDGITVECGFKDY